MLATGRKFLLEPHNIQVPRNLYSSFEIPIAVLDPGVSTCTKRKKKKGEKTKQPMAEKDQQPKPR